MKNKIKIFMKRMVIFTGVATLILNITSCSLSKTDQQSESNSPETSPDNLKQTAFEKDMQYLSERGNHLPDFPPNSTMMEEMYLSLLIEFYESLGGEIDLSIVNPSNESANAVKKMAIIEAYDGYFMENNMLPSDLNYGTASFWLMKIQDSIQRRLYIRSDSTARIGDLLSRINVSTALHTWTQDANEVRTYTVGDLLEGEAKSEQLLTKLMAGEMMVSAYEDNCGEIQTIQTLKPKDTEDIYAWKSNEFFFWKESDDFEPEKTGEWDDWAFMSAVNYDSQLCLGLKLDETKVPYGAVVAALASLQRSYEGLEQNQIDEKIVLNERPYNWYVNQSETGKYSAVNYMPACAEMAMRYQGLSEVPSVKKMRKDNLSNGLVWDDVLVENVMRQYGLKFSDSFEIILDEMLDLLDKGNILFVMYRGDNSPEAHAVIIKGYSKMGSSVDFIISDPAYDMVGPFGYFEYTKDAQTMLSDMGRQVPRYFVIPKGK